jgi:hypothetical protein
MLRDLICTQVILKSYGEERLGVRCEAANSHIIVYYGAESFGPFTLSRDGLDEHFGVPLIGQVEEVNAYYRRQIEELLATPASESGIRMRSQPDVEGLLRDLGI